MTTEDNLNIIKESRRLAKAVRMKSVQGDVKIAVIGTSSIQYFVMVLRYLLHREGINAAIYEGEYDGITMDVFDSDSPLYRFKPDIVIIITHYTDIKGLPRPLDSEEEVDGMLDKVVSYYTSVWNRLSEIENVQVLQSNFVTPPLRVLGNIEAKVCYSRTNFYRRINERLYKAADEFVTIIDLETVAENIGKYSWFDYPSYFANKSGCRMEYVVDMVELFKKQIIAVRGRVRKCIVLDLDNTLWGGVVGDDGCDGIQLDPNNAVGEAYRYFQSYLLELKQRGVILAVCSKNDEKNAKEPFERNTNMILHMDDISCFVANWDDKVSNIKRIAGELNIGTDSLVFFDDNPAERDLVRSYLPEVYVVDVPADPALYAIQLDRENPFEWVQITKEDLLRVSSYNENRNRVEMESRFENYDEYLQALEMKGRAGILTHKDCGRFTQLLNKSNQFNLRTQRYTESEISNLIDGGDSKCVYVSLSDKFSEYGIISCVVLRKQGDDCFIESWVMSCRVLKRNVEGLMFSKILEISKEWGCKKIVGEYIPTQKNGMVSSLYVSLGFEQIYSGDIKCYAYDTDKEYDEGKIYIERV